MKVLIVDDDLVLADVVSFTMRRAGFNVILAHDGCAALESWRSEQPVLIILDIKLPRLDGLAVCQRIRTEANTPIIMLTVLGEDVNIIRALEMGADDYIVKPFSPTQLVARAKAVLRRNGIQFRPSHLQIGNLILDRSRWEVVHHNGDRVTLTHLEFRLLEVLAINLGQVLLTDCLLDEVWGINDGDSTMLKQLIHRLRHKIDLKGMPSYIKTVPGIGYTLTTLAVLDDDA